MPLLTFYINFMGLIGCCSNHCCLDAKSLKANFLEANEAQAMNCSFTVVTIQNTLSSCCSVFNPKPQ